MNKTEFGKIGESITCKYLCQNHYKIIDKNYYYKGGEIDIIAYDEDKNEIVFIEVKTRTDGNYGSPSDPVNKRKISNITKGIRKYIHIKNLEKKFIRLDLIELFYKDKKGYINQIGQII